MKKLALVLSLVSLVTVSSKAIDTNILSFRQGVLSNRTVTVSLYPSYAPSLAKKWGFGAAAFYPLSTHTFTGLRMDYLSGDFFAAQANAGVKYNFQVMNHDFTVLGITGALIPIQGVGSDNFTPGAIIGAGLDTTVYQTTIDTHPFSIDLAVEGERWQVPGSVLDGVFVMHVVGSFTIKF